MTIREYSRLPTKDGISETTVWNFVSLIVYFQLIKVPAAFHVYLVSNTFERHAKDFF